MRGTRLNNPQETNHGIAKYTNGHVPLRAMALLTFTNKGVYCPQADVYIDPNKAVPRALITHGHADHVRWGHQSYLCSDSAKPVIAHRLGNINLSSLPYGQSTTINGVRISFHPAGHIVGSAQIRLEYKGEIWVVSGDYKLENDGISEPFEPVPCHNFITECTFGLPIYRWQDQASVAAEINAWWAHNQAEGKISMLSTYALGKAQRLLGLLDPSIGRIYTHGAIENINEIIRKQGISLAPTTRISGQTKKRDYIGSILLATPSVIRSAWAQKFDNLAIGITSGWMSLRKLQKARTADAGFVLSDHADWDGLNTAVKESGAERVFVTHGSTQIFKQWLNEQGIIAEEVHTNTATDSKTPIDQ